ncbi:hypothetical protein DOY81_009306 [Sarcophaga bullata]|nr:hypothetical protein DOY81_009306 [Sarcophaga bullata]
MVEELLLITFMSSSDSEDNNNVMYLRRLLRDKSNPLSLTNKAFKQRFRLSKDSLDISQQQYHHSFSLQQHFLFWLMVVSNMLLAMTI